MDYKEKLIQLLNSKELTKEEKERLCEIFPELAESEDEEIRRGIKVLVGVYAAHNDFREKMLAWLEKQGEQKHVEWTEQDKQFLLVCKNALAKYQVSDKWDANIISRWLENKLKSLRPQRQWKPSEEMLEALYRAIPENTMAISEDEMLLDKLYQGLKYGRVLSNN